MANKVENLPNIMQKHMRKVEGLVDTLPSVFTFRELVTKAGYDDVKLLTRGMRARIARAIPGSYRTDKKREGLRLYLKRRPQDLEGWSYMISNVVEWLEELKEFGWIYDFSY